MEETRREKKESTYAGGITILWWLTVVMAMCWSILI